MPIPPGIDMDLIREAMRNRAMDENIPIGNQLTSPMGQTPMGGPNTPTVPPPPEPELPPAVVGRTPRIGGAAPTARAAQAGQIAQGPSFDEETRKIAKILIQKLIGVL